MPLNDNFTLKQRFGFGVHGRENTFTVLLHLVAYAEAMATLRAVSFVQEFSLLPIVLEGDSEAIIKALSSEDESFASYGHLIVEAKLFTNTFCFLSFFFIFIDNITLQFMTLLDIVDMLAVYLCGEGCSSTYQ